MYFCHQVSVKLSCCIVLIMKFTNTAEFKADTDTGIGIGASLLDNSALKCVELEQPDKIDQII